VEIKSPNFEESPEKLPLSSQYNGYKGLTGNIIKSKKSDSRHSGD
jgi:hypothetical protein